MSRLSINTNWTKKVYMDGFSDDNLLKDLEEKKIVINAGILLYSPRDDSVILGIFEDTTDYCYFGGGRRCKETIFSAALRELKEETLECIEINEELDKCPCIILVDFNNKKFCYIIFIATPTNSDMDVIIDNFEKKLVEKINKINDGSIKGRVEITSIIKLSSERFFNLLYEPIEYKFKKLNINKDVKDKKDRVNRKTIELKDDNGNIDEANEQKDYKLYDNFRKILKFKNKNEKNRYIEETEKNKHIREIFAYIRNRNYNGNFSRN